MKETSMQILAGLDSNADKLLDAGNVMHVSSQSFIEARSATLAAMSNSMTKLAQDVCGTLQEIGAGLKLTEEQVQRLYGMFGEMVKNGFISMSSEMQKAFSDHQQFITDTRLQVDLLAGRIGTFTEQLSSVQFPAAELQSFAQSLQTVRNGLHQLPDSLGRVMAEAFKSMPAATPPALASGRHTPLQQGEVAVTFPSELTQTLAALNDNRPYRN